ncbi:MAG: bifunctional diaminohydroxyphosphoribosylaminopyrimidine deaminase/5-amino-6-(5-phosphoribosylamino)uracil reductase RibD [Leptothrix sp. (in: Bacteria)]|nr:bifunctional diaminohydroxyphosphoribosylaminopyrimidine deaminase/5-amino-6-(5-phosphoribosylamino)uracil reductase RibD [Leptothrix sp. (in: b-proteobacteria)]
MTTSKLDRDRLSEALALAEQAISLSDPNPRVGCVIGDEAGAVFGRGHTQQAGGPHAEIMALRDAAAAGRSVRGATAWVTLEPCAHHGRTPPCCDALVAARLRRVVVALADPFPQVAGEGIARLRTAGIEVDFAPADIAEQAWALNIGFFSRVLRRRPWVRVKIASSLDGRTALANGASQWITSPEARADGHAWRRRAGAVLTGIGTVLADDPRLDVRLVPTVLQPVRVVVDSTLRTPPPARLLDAPGTAWIATAVASSHAASDLRARGVELLALPAPDGRVDLAALLQVLADRAINEVHVEAGAGLTGALLGAGLADEVLAYVAPVLLGGGRGWVDWPGLQVVDDGLRLQLLEARQIGPDLRLRLAPANALPLSHPGRGVNPASAPFTHGGTCM